MPRRQRATISELRAAVECLPRHTRIAMLEGLEANDIIVGAYTSDGGVCPMLAAHRAGGRTNLISFAHAWDRFAFRDSKANGARRATERELRVLQTQLEASLLNEDVPTGELRAAVAEHRALVSRQAPEHRNLVSRRGPERPGDADRSRELRKRPGWSWLRPFRRYDEYAAALEHVRAAEPGREREVVG